ncbi:hypothetical protein SBDP1_270034 [Syntrophobacter sp. SbD1]|nr:hypothetical protein SBDP1_270034 [Syntrophobacter sp. SbD1]
MTPGKPCKPFYDTQATPKKVVDYMDDRPGKSLAEREQKHAQKSKWQNHETDIRHQKDVRKKSGQGESVEIENYEWKKHNIDCNGNPESVFELGYYPAGQAFRLKGGKNPVKPDRAKPRIDDDDRKHACKCQLESYLPQVVRDKRQDDQGGKGQDSERVYCTVPEAGYEKYRQG